MDSFNILQRGKRRWFKYKTGMLHEFIAQQAVFGNRKTMPLAERRLIMVAIEKLQNAPLALGQIANQYILETHIARAA